MSRYDVFAAYYDALTDDVDYAHRASYLRQLLLRFGVPDGTLLDLACGTASMTLEMASFGYEMIGVDASAEMLCAAQQKAFAGGHNILFLCQPMQRLDLYGTVRGTICTLDSLNHLTDPADVRETIRRVSLFTEPDGVFLFDVNTMYKHRQILSDNTFIRESEDLFCVWQNERIDDGLVQITLDFFERQEDDVYIRSREQFCERAYEIDWLTQTLRENGFSVEAVFAEGTHSPPQSDTQRVVFAAIKKEVKSLKPTHDKKA